MRIFNQAAILLITLYQKTLSPDKGLLRFWLQGRICAHEPHCSEYAKQCFHRYPFFTALHYTMERISACTPHYEKIYDPSSYRVVFFSSSPIGVPFLQALATDARFDLVGVVTMPDAPVGRGMKLQENIVKQEAKKIASVHHDQGCSKIILLHGKDATPEDKWYPWFINEVKKREMLVLAPYLPHSDNPVLAEWVEELDRLDIDEATCVVAHSRGGVALLRRIETRKKKVGKIVLIGTNDSVYTEEKNGFFTQQDYDYHLIKDCCDDITVLHAPDDQTVPFAHGEKIASGLGAKTWFPTGFGHFGKNLGEKFEQLLDFVFPSFVSTPRSLRLDSKKYAADAESFKEWVSNLKPDLFVVIAYGHIMPQRVLDIPVFGSINVHGSLLPAYRGASPLQSVFLDGQKETGITVMKMDAGVDTGCMIKKLITPLPIHRTVIDLIERIKKQGPTFLNRVLRDWCKGVLVAEPQDPEKATLCRKFEKEDGQIDPFHDDLLQVRYKRQAFALRPKLFFMYSGKRITIDHINLQEHTTTSDMLGQTLFSSGGSGIDLHASIALLRLVPEGKKALTREQFVNGYVK